MRSIKALYGALAIGAAAAAVAAPFVARKLVWPSAQTAPVRTASDETPSAPGAPASVTVGPNPPAPAPPAMPALASATSGSANATSSGDIEPKPDGASASLEPKLAAPASPVPEPVAGRPAFDVVRVDPTGETVVAGHATPKAAVELRDGGRVIAKVDADESGQFVVLPPPLPTGSHRLELAARDDGAPAQVSDAVTIDVAAQKPDVRHSAPSQAPAPKTTAAPAQPVSEVRVASAAAAEGAPQKPAPTGVAAPAPGPAVPPQQAPVASVERLEPLHALSVAAVDAKPAPTRAAAPAPATAVAAQPNTPALGKPLALLQTPGLPVEAGPHVSVRTVDAPGAGRLEVRGIAEPNSRLRLYLNGSPVADASAGPDQRWSLTIEHGMSPGFYTFRADEIDRANGAVSARAEVPFSYPQRPVETGASLFEAPSGPPPVPTSSPGFTVATAPDAPSTAAAPSAQSPAAPLLTQPGTTPPSAANSPPAQSPAAATRLALSPAQAVIPAPPATPPTNVVIADVQTTTVVRGDNLWDLARRFYGDGMRFRQIYAANASQIREPRLIYIGQKFVVPKEAAP